MKSLGNCTVRECRSNTNFSEATVEVRHNNTRLRNKNEPPVRSVGSDPHQSCKRRRPPSERESRTTRQNPTQFDHDSSCPKNLNKHKSCIHQLNSEVKSPTNNTHSENTMILKNLNHRIYDSTKCTSIIKSSKSDKTKNSIKKRVEFKIDDNSRHNQTLHNMVSAYAPAGKRRNGGVADGRSAPHTEPK